MGNAAPREVYAKDNLSQLAEQAEVPYIPGLYRYNRFLVVIVETLKDGQKKEHVLYEADAGSEGWYHMRTKFIRLSRSTPFRVEARLVGIAYH